MHGHQDILQHNSTEISYSIHLYNMFRLFSARYQTTVHLLIVSYFVSAHFGFFSHQADRKKWGGGDTALSKLANLPLQETASIMEGRLFKGKCNN